MKHLWFRLVVFAAILLAPVQRAEAQDGWEPNNDPSQAHAVMFGVPVTSTLTPGDADWFAFIGLPGTTYYCRVIGADFYPAIQILQSGSVLATGASGPDTNRLYTRFVAPDGNPVLVGVGSALGAGQYELLCGYYVPAPARTPTPTAAPATPAPTPSPTPTAMLDVLIFADINGDQIMSRDEGVDEMAILVSAPNASWSSFAVTRRGRTTVALPVAVGESVLIEVPYLGLARLVVVRADQGRLTAQFRLAGARYPVYLP